MNFSFKVNSNSTEHLNGNAPVNPVDVDEKHLYDDNINNTSTLLVSNKMNGATKKVSQVSKPVSHSVLKVDFYFSMGSL